MRFKQVFILLNMRFKLPLKIIYLVRKERKIVLVEWVWTKKLLTMNPMEKQITKMNTTPDIGGPLINFLPYTAKTQLSLPRGKKN